VTAALRTRWRWVAAAAAVVVAVPLALAALGGPDDGPATSGNEDAVAIGRSVESGGAAAPGLAVPDGAAPDAAPDAAAAPATEVVFELTGSGTVDVVTYSRGSAVAQVSEVELPWEQTLPGAEGPAEYSLSAAGTSGEIACRIIVDGVVLAEQALGEYAAISCSGRL
ncbi:MAG: MmpS family transport accessory protein, partial [Pseudonocardiales bacterium]|nr:MmpS family transport accessory protein [Pseudonocardiales bacterium]